MLRFSPTMLIPIGLGPTDDPHLWWTVFEPSKGWNEETRFPRN